MDIKGGLENIGSKAQNGDYSNEYDFQKAIYDLIYSSYDQHFNYLPDIISVFSFWRDNALYSVSSDGQELPQVYMDVDVEGGLGSNASPVTRINGQPVEDFLKSAADQLGGGQDKDANYNSMFPIIPSLSTRQNPYSGFQYANTYQGGTTEVTLQNGTTRQINTYAMTTKDFTGVTNGRAFFQRFCGQTPTSSAAPSGSAFPSASFPSSAYYYPSFSLKARQAPSSSAAAFFSIPFSSPFASFSSFSAEPTPSNIPSAFASSASFGIPLQSNQVQYSAVPSQTAAPALPAFPKAWVAASDFSVACYFPQDSSDLAVLSIPTFEPLNANQFSSVVRQCLATANKKGKSRLIVDLRGNGGGTVFLAYDLFKQLFPKLVPYGTTNFRAFELFNDIGKTVTEYYEDVDGYSPRLAYTNFGSIFNTDDELDSMNDQFEDWDDFYGPVNVHGDEFTHLVRYNLSDPISTGNISITGFGGLQGNPRTTFSPDNVVMLTDGICASTCAVFSELMKTQAKVRSIAIGGRPQTGVMQAVGGVKGANVYTGQYLLSIIFQAFTNEADRSDQQELADKYGEQVQALNYAITRSYLDSTGMYSQARVNIRNNIRKDDDTLTPLQFVYEAADCRLFYTANMINDQEAVWSATSRANWNNNAGCIQGSTGDSTSKPGVGYIEKQNPDDKGAGESAAGRTSVGFAGVAVSVASILFALLLL